MKNHLCFMCTNSKQEEVESHREILVSFGCKFKDADVHRMVVTMPSTNHIVECSKYRKAPFLDRMRRKFLWRWS